jgi:hypothetical protein
VNNPPIIALAGAGGGLGGWIVKALAVRFSTMSRRKAVQASICISVCLSKAEQVQEPEDFRL